MVVLEQFIFDLLNILNEMSPYLLLGFLFAGILKVFIPQKLISKYLGASNLRASIYSALLGVPLPLCSCGVIPTGVSIYKSGASKGSTVSFLIATPQTGLDSILATFALLGIPFAVVRPIVALVTGIFGGLVTNYVNKFEQNKKDNSNNIDVFCEYESSNQNTQKEHSKVYELFKYAFVDFLKDIYKWLVIGLLIAGAISVLIPDNFFEQFIGNQWLEMVVILLISIPLYVCATGSIPIAAILMIKGLSPGAALVFLMAGPATNAATITVLRKALGKYTMWSYLISIIIGAIVAGSIINYFLPSQWFNVSANLSLHNHHIIPEWMKWVSSILLIGLIINAYYKKNKQKTKDLKSMNEIIINVKGMSCTHCKSSVEKHISAFGEIDSVKVDLSKQELHLTGENIDLKRVEEEINSLGFEYGGTKQK